MACFLIFTSCTKQSSTNSKSVVKLNQYKSDVYHYSIEAPLNFEIGKHAVQGIIKGPGFYSPDGTNVDIYEDSFPCSPELTGASETTKLTTANGMAEWGRVNIFDSGGMDFPPDFKDLCRPPVYGSAYVFCSEKEEKTVVVCISQVKDDAELAKKIFETFKWTK